MLQQPSQKTSLRENFDYKNKFINTVKLSHKFVVDA